MGNPIYNVNLANVSHCLIHIYTLGWTFHDGLSTLLSFYSTTLATLRVLFWHEYECKIVCRNLRWISQVKWSSHFVRILLGFIDFIERFLSCLILWRFKCQTSSSSSTPLLSLMHESRLAFMSFFMFEFYFSSLFLL